MTVEARKLFDGYIQQWGTPMKIIHKQCPGFLRRLSCLGADLADIEQNALIAVMRAAEKYIAGGSAKFSTYAHACAMGAVRHEYRRMAAKKRLSSLKKIHLDQCIREEREGWYDPFPNIIESEFKVALLKDLLKGSERRGLALLKMRYGIGCQEMTTKECGNKYGISQQRVIQITHRTIKKLYDRAKEEWPEMFEEAELRAVALATPPTPPAHPG